MLAHGASSRFLPLLLAILLAPTGRAAINPEDPPVETVPLAESPSPALTEAISDSEAENLNNQHDDWYSRSPDARTADELRQIRDSMQGFVDRWNSYPTALDQNRNGNFDEEWGRLDRDIDRQDWYQNLAPERFNQFPPEQQEQILQQGCDQYGSCHGRQPTPPQEGPIMFDGETEEKAIVEAPNEGLPTGS